MQASTVVAVSERQHNVFRLEKIPYILHALSVNVFLFNDILWQAATKTLTKGVTKIYEIIQSCLLQSRQLV